MSGRPRGGGPLGGAGSGDGLVDLGLWCVGLAGGLCAAVWGWGQLAGLVLGDGRPALPLGRTPRVLAALPAHLADPRAAWPATDRALLPGAVGFYAALAAVLVLAAALVVTARRLRGRPSRRRHGGALASERGGWARRGELAALRVARPTAGRLALGRTGRTLLAAEARQSVIVIGPTGSMKTTGFAVPAILEWDGPVLATSVKTDLVADTLGARGLRGRTWVYDPTRATGLPRAGWSPLGSCADWHGAQRAASWLVGAAEAREGLGQADFWHAAAAKLLGPLLLAAASSGADMARVVGWLDAQAEREPLDLLRALGDEAAIRAFEASLMREERQRSSIYTTAETVLAPFADPVVAASAGWREISAASLLDGGAHALYLCAPAHEQRRLRPLFVCLIQEVLAAAFARGGCAPLDPPLLVVLDEAANVAALPDLDGLAATAAGQGVQLVSVWHDVAQIRARYGPRADTLLSNHRAKVLLSGVSDPATLDLVSRLAGEEQAELFSSTRGADGRRSRTSWRAPRRLAAPADLRRVRPGEGVLIYGHLAPTALRLRPWFREPALRRLLDRAAREASERTGPGAEPPAPVSGRPDTGRTTVEATGSGAGIAGVGAHVHGGATLADSPTDEATLAGKPDSEPAGASGHPEPDPRSIASALSPTRAAELMGVSRSRIYERWAAGRLAWVDAPDARGRVRRRVPLAAVAAELGVEPGELEWRLRMTKEEGC